MEQLPYKLFSLKNPYLIEYVDCNKFGIHVLNNVFMDY